MAEKHTKQSRAHRYEKKRKSTILINWLVGAGSALLILLIALTLFNGDDQAGNAKSSDDGYAEDKKTTEDSANQENSGESSNEQEDTESEKKASESNKESETNEEKEETPNSEESSNEDQPADSETESESEEDSDDETSTEQEEEVVIDNPEKENVERIVKKEWAPVPTELSTNGEHTISYSKGTQEWKEMETAAANATGLSQDDMITWWIGNGGGPQKAEATISNKDKTEHYRVSIQWVEGQGYQPTRVEVLEEKEVNR